MLYMYSTSVFRRNHERIAIILFYCICNINPTKATTFKILDIEGKVNQKDVNQRFYSYTAQNHNMAMKPGIK